MLFAIYPLWQPGKGHNVFVKAGFVASLWDCSLMSWGLEQYCIVLLKNPGVIKKMQSCTYHKMDVLGEKCEVKKLTN